MFNPQGSVKQSPESIKGEQVAQNTFQYHRG